MKTKLLLLLLLTCIFSYSQTIPPAGEFTKSEYLRKAHVERTIGWVMLAGGVVVNTLGFTLMSNNLINNILENQNKGEAYIIIGTATMLGSVPFFISAGKNTRNAVYGTVSYKTLSTPSSSTFFKAHLYPAINVSIRL